MKNILLISALLLTSTTTVAAVSQEVAKTVSDALQASNGTPVVLKGELTSGYLDEDGRSIYTFEDSTVKDHSGAITLVVEDGDTDRIKENGGMFGEEDAIITGKVERDGGEFTIDVDEMHYARYLKLVK